jgi:hypothetical protein
MRPSSETIGDDQLQRVIAYYLAIWQIDGNATESLFVSSTFEGNACRGPTGSATPA